MDEQPNEQRDKPSQAEGEDPQRSPEPDTAGPEGHPSQAEGEDPAGEPSGE
jgi:hypothetical protein